MTDFEHTVSELVRKFPSRDRVVLEEVVRAAANHPRFCIAGGSVVAALCEWVTDTEDSDVDMFYLRDEDAPSTAEGALEAFLALHPAIRAASQEGFVVKDYDYAPMNFFRIDTSNRIYRRAVITVRVADVNIQLVITRYTGVYALLTDFHIDAVQCALHMGRVVVKPCAARAHATRTIHFYAHILDKDSLTAQKLFRALNKYRNRGFQTGVFEGWGEDPGMPATAALAQLRPRFMPRLDVTMYGVRSSWTHMIRFVDARDAFVSVDPPGHVNAEMLFELFAGTDGKSHMEYAYFWQTSQWKGIAIDWLLMNNTWYNTLCHWKPSDDVRKFIYTALWGAWVQLGPRHYTSLPPGEWRDFFYTLSHVFPELQQIIIQNVADNVYARVLVGERIAWRIPRSSLM